MQSKSKARATIKAEFREDWLVALFDDQLWECQYAREWQREKMLFQDHVVIVHESWWSFRHSGMVKMQLTKVGRVESCRQESFVIRVCWFRCPMVHFSVPMVLPRLARESCIKRCNLREKRSVEIRNSCMLTSITRPCTLYIPAQLLSVHSLEQV